MRSYEFSLMVTGVEEDKLDGIYEATNGEATVEFGSAFANRVAFEVEADSLADAILTAIHQVEEVPGLQVTRVEPDEYVYAAEIATRLGRTRQNIDQLIRGQRGPGGFPPPVIGNSRNPLWKWIEVQKWFAEYENRPFDEEWSTVIGAINGALESRNALRDSGDGQLAKKLTKMVGEQTRSHK